MNKSIFINTLIYCCHQCLMLEIPSSQSSHQPIDPWEDHLRSRLHADIELTTRKQTGPGVFVGPFVVFFGREMGGSGNIFKSSWKLNLIIPEFLGKFLAQLLGQFLSRKRIWFSLETAAQMCIFQRSLRRHLPEWPEPSEPSDPFDASRLELEQRRLARLDKETASGILQLIHVHAEISSFGAGNLHFAGENVSFRG